MSNETRSQVPHTAHFKEQDALQLLVPRAKVLAALADALVTAPAGDNVTIPRAPTAALLRPFISCPEAELPEAWEAMLRIAATMAGRAALPAPPAPPAALGAPGEVVKAVREYLGVHPDLQLGGQVLDSMALDLARISMDFPADLIGALALEELMQLGYTVEAGAILPPRDLPEMACEFFGVRPVGRVPALKPVERQALEGLCAVAAAAHHVADDSPYDGATVAVEYSDMEALGQALDKLEGLPDDQPGYLMGPASKAEWALRRLLDAAPLLEAPAAPVDVGVVFDMVALVKQFVREHRVAEPHSLLAGAAMKYLQRHGLLDSPLRLHSDDAALDRFALAMRAKLAAAREQGRGGWETCPPEVLNRMLHEHIAKGDPRDVANFCMFLWCTGQPTTVAAPAAPASDMALLDAMTQHRIAVVPENEGPWDAQVYGATKATPLARATGATPREALSAAVAALPAALDAMHTAIDGKPKGAAVPTNS